ncbi:unnamed protein product, partial [Rotaria sordida]
CLKFHFYPSILVAGSIDDELELRNGLIIDVFSDLREQLDSMKETLDKSYVWEMYQSRKEDIFPIDDCFRSQYGSGSGEITTTKSLKKCI